tara:strand:+ start:88386 stop:89012 length:627 start_codon:yes stop_codon:yes gene_type:complete
MEESKKKKGLFGKVFSVLSGKPSSPPDSAGQFAPDEKEPVDLVFVKRFTNSGGKFLYCEQEEEAYEFLRNIQSEASVESIICQDSNLQSILKNAGLGFKSESNANEDAYCCSCEYLISFNGGLMISENQTHGKKLKDLPDVFIVIAKTSQIVENLRAGLTGIRAKYKGNIPSNITTIKGPNHRDEANEMASETACVKDIYLLLIEDQL